MTEHDLWSIFVLSIAELKEAQHRDKYYISINLYWKTRKEKWPSVLTSTGKGGINVVGENSGAVLRQQLLAIFSLFFPSPTVTNICSNASENPVHLECRMCTFSPIPLVSEQVWARRTFPRDEGLRVCKKHCILQPRDRRTEIEKWKMRQGCTKVQDIQELRDESEEGRDVRSEEKSWKVGERQRKLTCWVLSQGKRERVRKEIQNVWETPTTKTVCCIDSWGLQLTGGSEL